MVITSGNPSEKKLLKFPEKFFWGCSSKALQIEGLQFFDGCGTSIWKDFYRIKGQVKGWTSPETGSQHCRRYEEDIGILADMGVKAYRMSFSWPAIIPEGKGKVNQKGLDFYDRVIDGLLEKNIIPVVALFYREFPLILFKNKIDFRNREIVNIFCDYVIIIVKYFSDRIKYWETFDTPSLMVKYGYKEGSQPPYLELNEVELYPVIHNILISHGHAVKIIRETARNSTFIGVSFDLQFKNNFCNDLYWFEPVFKGRYPEEFLRNIKNHISDNHLADDMKVISSPVDYITLEIKQETLENSKKRSDDKEIFNYSVFSDIKYLKNNYNPQAFFITQNAGYDDVLLPEGRVHDYERINFMKNSLACLHNLISDGVNINGVFWQFMDCFEPDYPGSRRGLIYVEPKTYNRILKDSAYWYKNIIKNNGFKF